MLLPLYGCTWLWREVVAYAVDCRHLLEDAVSNLHEDRPFYLLDGGCHGVNCIDGADDDWPVIAARVVFHTYALEVWHDGEVLPNLLVEASLGKLLAEDSIALTESFKTVACDGSKAADTEAWTWEWLTVYHLVWESELHAACAHLVFEELLERFDKLEL